MRINGSITKTICIFLFLVQLGKADVITFSTNADYDNNFKEAPVFNGIVRSPAGYLELLGSPNGTAAFDTSATGGVNGFGGTGGSDANNNFSNFTISADAASSFPGGIGVGFLLRMNAAESNGYFASVLAQSPIAVQFFVFEGSGLTTAGNQIFTTTVPLSGLTLAANTFYPFKVTVTGGTFFFDFGSGAATTSFTDTTVSATTGQVGISLATINPGIATRLDNFSIVPEPGSAAVLFLGLGYLAMTRKRSSKCSF